MEAMVGRQILGSLGQVRNAPRSAGAAFRSGASKWFCKIISSSKRYCRALSCVSFLMRKMAEYRRPFCRARRGNAGPPSPGPREIPIEGDPSDVTAIVDAYADWLETSLVPQAISEGGARRHFWRVGRFLEHARSLPAQTEVTIRGIHFVSGRFARRDRKKRLPVG